MVLDVTWWHEECGRFQKEIGHIFSRPDLLQEAFTHKSYANEKGLPYSNERLEFLGDAVLELGVSKRLFRENPLWDEGALTKARAAMVCENSLASQARERGILPLLLLGRGLEKQGGRSNLSIGADLVEACIGALFLDGGMEAAEKLIRFIYESCTPEEVLFAISRDYKSELQKRFQVLGKELPEYVLLHQEGPSHAPLFHVGIFENQRCFARGKGKSRKVAEREAAKEALDRLGILSAKDHDDSLS